MPKPSRLDALGRDQPKTPKMQILINNAGAWFIVRMITWKLAQRLEGSGVVINTVGPGTVKTEFLSNASGFSAKLMALAVKIVGVTPGQGAITPLWVALAPELSAVSGRFFEGKKEKKGGFRNQMQLDQLEELLDGMIRIGSG